MNLLSIVYPLSTICAIWDIVCPIVRVVLGLLFIAGVGAFVLRRYQLYNPIVRDRILVGGNYIRQVIILVLSIPLVLAVGFLIMDLRGNTLLGDETLADKGLFSTIWAVFYHFVDPGNQHMATDAFSSIVVAIVALLGIFALNGLLVSTIINWVEDRKQKWERGDVRYGHLNYFKDYVVIIGGHEMVPQLCRHIFERSNPPYVLIQCQGIVSLMRRKLRSALTDEQEARVIIYYGDRTSEEDIASLRLERAREIFLIGENTKIDENEHDALNMLSLNHIADYLNANVKEERQVSCRVMFEYQTTFSVFQFSDLDAHKRKKIIFRPFNFYEMWAQRIFVKSLGVGVQEADYYHPLDTDFVEKDKATYGIDYNSDKRVHLVIVGMSKVGIAMAVEAAHVAHYPNFLRDTKLRTKITFIDANAWQEMHFFKGRYKDLFELSQWRYEDKLGRREVEKNTPDAKKWKHLGNLEELIDIEWEFIDGTLESSAVQNYLQELADKEDELLTIAMCLTQTHQAVAGALYMPSQTIEKAVQVLVYQPFHQSIIDNISGDTAVNDRYKRFKPFGMVTSGCEVVGMSDPSAHLINYIYWNVEDWALKKTIATQTNPDGTVVEINCVESNWREVVSSAENGKSGSAARWSNIYNANTIPTKLRSIGWSMDKLLNEQGNVADLTDEEVDLLARVEHNRWVVEQLLLNYRPVDEAMQVRITKDCKELSRLEAEMKGEIAKCKDDDAIKAVKERYKPLMKSLKKLKDEQKREMYHHDICTYQKLIEVDEPTLKYDCAIVKALPYIVEKLQLK